MKLPIACLSSFVLGALLLAGCGDDDGTVVTDSGSGPVDSGPRADSGVAVDGGGMSVDSGGVGVDSGGVGVDAGGMPTGDAGTFVPSAAAMYFCDGYSSVCMFGTTGHYADRDTCLRAYDGYAMSRQLCVANALGMAASDPSQCAAASGSAPCT